MSDEKKTKLELVHSVDEAVAIKLPEDIPEGCEPWRRELVTTTVHAKGGTSYTFAKNLQANVIVILRRHKSWEKVLAWNAFSEQVVATVVPPWDPSDAPPDCKPGAWCDPDNVRAGSWLARNEQLTVGIDVIIGAIEVVARSNPIHPVRDYLETLRWDGVERLPGWLATYCGATQSEYTAQVGRRWMISAVARVFEPGCQVDCVLILEGKQGIRKSSALRALVPSPELYTETGVNVGDKDSYQLLHGIWIYSFEELASLKRGDLEKTKSFITSPKDRYRPSYGRGTRDFPRQNVFAGTTNEDQYFIDRTGNRRFWPILVETACDVEAIVRDRDQLWAEALVRYRRGEKWHVDTPELKALCEAEQSKRVLPDPWEDIVAQWLQNPSKIVEETGYGGVLQRVKVEYDISQGLLLVDVLRYSGVEAKGTPGDVQRMSSVLRALGYEKGKQHRESGDRLRRWFMPTPAVTSRDLEPGDGLTTGKEK